VARWPTEPLRGRVRPAEHLTDGQGRPAPVQHRLRLRELPRLAEVDPVRLFQLIIEIRRHEDRHDGHHRPVAGTHVAVVLVDEQRRLPVVAGEHGVGQGPVYLGQQAGLIEAGLVLVEQLNQQRAGVRLRHRKPDLTAAPPKGP